MTRRVLTAIGFVSAVAIAALCLATAARATPGDLDPTFSNDGYRRVDLGGISSAAQVALDSSSRIVVAATATTDDVSRPSIIRLQRDGGLDRRFGKNGVARLATTGRGPTLNIDSQGRILSAAADSGRFVVVRLLRNGTPDPEFGVHGVAAVAVTGLKSVAGITVEPDGRVLAVGTTGNPGDRYDDDPRANHLIAVRLTGSGALDPSYADGGTMRFDYAGATVSTATSTAAQPDGSTVIGGYSSAGGAVASLGPDGLIDASFANGGTATAVGGSVADVELDSSGRILLATCCAVATRLLSDGTRDPAFAASAGRGLLPASDAVAVGADRVVSTTEVGGCYRGCINFDYVLTSVTSDGQAEEAFGFDGEVFQDFARSDDYARDIVIQRDGRIVVVGQSGQKVVVVRHEVSGGKADRDADGLIDKRDRCPERYGRAENGCPTFQRTITMTWRRAADQFTGAVESREAKCVNRREIEVRQKLPGFDKILATPTTAVDGSWHTDAPLSAGVYYVRIPEDFQRAVGECAGANSNELTIH